MVFFLYRVVRDRRRRMMARFTKKVAMLPEVKAVAVRNDQIIVVLGRAPAKTYIRVSSLLDGANGKLFYGKPIAGTIRDDMTDEELRTLIKQPGAVYVRDDVVFGPPGEGSTSGGSPKGRGLAGRAAVLHDLGEDARLFAAGLRSGTTIEIFPLSASDRP